MINKIYQSKFYPLVFQMLSLLVFGLLIYGAIGVYTDDPVFAKQLRNTNLPNLIVWSYWWPFIVLTAVLFGRHWCSICPIELVSFLASRVGLRLKVPKIIKTGWFITILYAFIAIVAIHTWGIHRVPLLMAVYLLSLTVLAIIVSLLFEKRAFCSYFCPVGKLLGLYSMVSPWRLIVKDQNLCEVCKSKDCISKKNDNFFVGRSCQSGLYPAKISDSKDCILCTQCVKACPDNNPALKISRKNILSIDFLKLSWAEIGMVSILMGFISYEILSSWKESKVLLMYIPGKLFEIFPDGIISKSLFEAVVLFVILPLTILMLMSLIGSFIANMRFVDFLKKLSGYILPVVAFGHVFKALLKSTSRLPYWSYALDKPDGVFYAQKLIDKDVTLFSTPLLDLVITIIGLMVISYGLYISYRKLNTDKSLCMNGKLLIGLTVICYFLLLIYEPLESIF